MKIVVPEKISPQGIQEFQNEPGWQVVQLTPASVQSGELARELADADALVVRSAIKVTPELLESAPKLRVIGRAGIGVDNVNLEAATRKGIVVMNTPGGSSSSVAELAIGMMIALARKLCQADALTRAGKWEKKSLQGSELEGKTLGVLGLGRIGMELARRARAFSMQVVAYDPFASPVAARELGVKLLPLDEALAQSDYLSLHMALTPETESILNAANLAKTKKGVRIVNCARGELIDENALLDALKSGQVGGAALDVFRKEPPGEHPLFALPNVIATPHIAGSTHEAQERVGYRIAVQIKEYLSQGIIQNAVNVPSVGFEEYKELQPWLALGEKIGSLLAQLASGQPRDLALRYGGELAEMNTGLIRNSVITGVLNRAFTSDDKANIINAKAMAEQRGVALHQGKWENSRGLARSLSVVLKTDTDELTLQGAVLHGSTPRLIGIDDIDIEAPLGARLLIMRNDDVPGVIGHVGSVLGKRGINIASFSLGRQEANGAAKKPLRAVAVVQVDADVSEDVIAELKQFKAVHFAQLVRL